MPEVLSPERQRKQEKLRADYRDALSRRIERIQACWVAVRGGGAGSSSAQELVRQVHGLAGSAAAFGMPRLGEVARELELALEDLDAAGPVHDADRIATVDGGIASLKTLAHDAPVSPAQPVALAGPAPEPAAPGENRLICLIEDDALVAEGLAAQLATFGWEVRQLPDASTAGAVLAAESPAAVIVDVSLPEGRHAGPELIGRLQAASQLRIPHVVMSSRWDWESRLAAARSGAEAYFVKPVDVPALIEQLEVLTRRRPLQPYRVLIVDDMTTLAHHYAHVLDDAGMHARVVDEPARLLDALADFSPELILMDLHMPQCTGIEAARVVRQDAKFTSLPIVFLSTESGRSKRLAAMRTGADDFLRKPIEAADLVAAVSVRAERFRALRALIQQDSLTGLLNHVAFKSVLEAELSRARRSGASTSLAMIDIDHFKRVNDGHGHPTGDRVIRALAQLLRSRLRRSDLIGRYGGEEFAVLLPETPQQTAIGVIDTLREQFARIRFSSAAGESFHCSFSAGVAAAQCPDDVGRFVGAADAALYDAKHAGRNRVRAAAPRPPAAAAGGRAAA